MNPAEPEDRHPLVNDLDGRAVYRPVLWQAALLGGGLGLVAGGLVGFAMGRGELMVTGLGQFVASGAVVASFTGAGLGLAVGALIGGLVGLGRLPRARRDSTTHTGDNP